MASEKTSGHKEPPNQINLEKKFYHILSQLGGSASNSLSLRPGSSRNENIDKTTSFVIETSTSGPSKRICSVGIEQQHDSEFKKARTESYPDPELRYRCSFCSQRFPSLTNVRDHTRACHREENERRKEERLNTSTTKAVAIYKHVEQETGPKLIQNPERKRMHLFRCIACKFASISYDNMIEHCQNHVIKFEDPQADIPFNKTKKYFICGEKFHVDFETYNECEDGSSSYTFINCDYKLLKRHMWPGIFTNLQKTEIEDINYTSMYYFTRLIRLTSQNKPSLVPYMIFKCKKCEKYIDPHSILLHVQENSCNEHDNDYPCHTCKKPFANENTMYLHYQMHRTADNSKMKFRTVLFNSHGDDIFNALLLKAAGYTMKIVPDKTQQRLRTDFAKAQTEVKNNQTNKKSDMQCVPSGSKTVIVSDAAKTKACDARSMIIGPKTGADNKTKYSITSSVMGEVDKLDTVYKCKCELCFHGLKFLLKHFEICGSEFNSAIISCTCDLLFNEEQFKIHCKIHSQGFTKLNVKTINVHDEKIVPLKNLYNSHVDNEIKKNLDNKMKKIEYEELCRKAIAKLIHTIQNVALLHIRGYKDKEVTKQKTIAKAAKRSVGSTTDDFIKAVLKTQGTMTKQIQASKTKSVGSGTDDLNTTVMKCQGTMTTPETVTVCKVNKGVDNIKHLSETKSVGSGTDDLNTTVMKSQGTMTTPETVTVCKVNKGVDNIKHLNEIKSVGSGTDDLNTTVMKSQGTMTTPEAVTVCIVNKGVVNIKNERETKSVGTETDDVNKTVLKSQRTMTTPEIQTVYKLNKGVDNITQVSQTKSDGSEADDLNISVKKSQETITLPATQTGYKNLGNTKEKGETNSSLSMLGQLESLYLEAQQAKKTNKEVNKHSNREPDNNQENLSMVESTLDAALNEITFTEKTKVNCNTASTGTNQESGNISTKECDQIKEANMSKNQGVTGIAAQAEENNTYEEMETDESEKNKDTKTGLCNAESKVYTEDELLNGPVTPLYFDAEESILTDDEDPILLYEDDDVD